MNIENPGKVILKVLFESQPNAQSFYESLRSRASFMAVKSQIEVDLAQQIGDLKLGGETEKARGKGATLTAGAKETSNLGGNSVRTRGC